MAIILDEENKVVTVENQPDAPRAMFPNIKEGGTAVEEAEAAAEAAEAAAARAETAAQQAMSGTPEGYENIVASIAAAFTMDAAYSTGDIVLYNGSLYEFTADHAAGAWDADEVQQITIGEELSDLNGFFPYVIGKNKYNAAVSGPENEKLYDASGVLKAGASYAVTGKIPVKPGTTYIFSSTPFSTTYAKVFFFKGSAGETYISSESNKSVPFTTPDDCTFIAFNLFGRTHTTQDFNDAIAVAQLEEGTVATGYASYISKRLLLPNNIAYGSALPVVTEYAPQINLYDKSLAVDGSYFNTSGGGSILQNALYAFTGKIPVLPNRQYNVSRDPNTPLTFGGSVYCFAADGSYLGAAPLSNYVYSYLYSFTTPANCVAVAVNMSASSAHTAQDFSDTVDTIMMCIGTQRPAVYVPFVETPLLKADMLSDAYSENENRFVGKKWLATGTSVTWYDGKLYQAGVNAGKICSGYVGYVARRTKINVINDGISGATLGNVNSNSLINRYTSLNWAEVDIATIEYGINDFGNAVAIGTAEDAAGTDTFAACLKTVIEYALTQNPKLCLVICTEPDVRGATANSGGHYLYEYTDVTIAIAKQYRLPVCDWFYHSGINALTKGNSSLDYLTADGTHPNDDGHMRMGAMLNQIFNDLIC